jgi:hypothetical protein
MLKYKAIIGLCLAALLALPVGACITSGNTIAPPELSVIKKALTADSSGQKTLAVTVKNTGRTNAELAEVKVSFYDAQNNLLDSSRNSVMNLGIGETWDFIFTCAGDNSKIASYDVAVTSGSSSGF